MDWNTVVELLLMAAGGLAGTAVGGPVGGAIGGNAAGMLGKLFVGKAVQTAEKNMARKALEKVGTAVVAARAAAPKIVRNHIPETLSGAGRGTGSFVGQALGGGFGAMGATGLYQGLFQSPAAEYQPHGAEALLGSPVHETGNDLNGLVSALESKLNSQSTNDDGEMDPQLESLLAALNQQGKALV